jgi:predicted N-acetyltransferase YhbS
MLALDARFVPDPVADCRRVVLRQEMSSDLPAREALLDAALGPGRLMKTCERLRVGRTPADGLALSATLGGRLVGTIRLWTIVAGDRPALLLGPLAVDEQARSRGLGGELMAEALTRAAARGHAAVLLVGDAPYYARFGFERRFTRHLRMPGPVQAERFLGLELVDGALGGAHGRVRPSPLGSAVPSLERQAA